ncbi:MAG: hypothetical protein Q7K45_03680 [Nanoarchaeota archaeon]|nr:hypothetical protein [Nanoarchaeota archaeon]
MKYLYRGLQNIGKSIREHKLLFILLILLQIGFLVALAYITITYQVKILNTAQEIILPLQNANYDPESIEQGKEFISEIAGIYQAYQALIQQIVRLALWWLGLFIVVNGVLWILSHQIMEKKSWKNLGKQWIKYAVATIVLLGPFLLVIYFLLKLIVRAQIDPDKFGQMLTYLMYSFGLMYYLMINAFASIQISSWKECVKHFFTTAIKKIHYTLPVLTINLALLSSTGYLIYYFMELNQNFALMMISSGIFIVLIVLTRLYWISCLRELTSTKISELQKPHHEKSHP